MASPEIEQLKELMTHYRICFSTESGAVVLRDLIRRFGYVRRSTFSPDPYSTARNEGQRSVLIYAGSMVEANPATVQENPHFGEFDDDDA